MRAILPGTITCALGPLPLQPPQAHLHPEPGENTPLHRGGNGRWGRFPHEANTGTSSFPTGHLTGGVPGRRNNLDSHTHLLHAWQKQPPTETQPSVSGSPRGQGTQGRQSEPSLHLQPQSSGPGLPLVCMNSPCPAHGHRRGVAQSVQGATLQPLSARWGNTETLASTSDQRVTKDDKPRAADEEGEPTCPKRAKARFSLATWQRHILLGQMRAAWGSSSADAEGQKPPGAAVPHGKLENAPLWYSHFHLPSSQSVGHGRAPHGSSRTQTEDEAGTSAGYTDVHGDSGVHGLELGSTGLRCEDTETKGDRQPPKAAPEPSSGGWPTTWEVEGVHASPGGVRLGPGPGR